MNAPRRGWISVSGRRLETASWGKEPPGIVLLHEGLGSVSLWRDFPARLAAATGHGVFAWSRAGYGNSGPVPLPRPVSNMHDEAAVLGALLDALGIGDCVLLGHSDGASIATIFAGTHHDPRVKGLALIAPHFLVEDVCLAGIAAARERYRAGELRARLARHHADVDGAFRGWNDVWLEPAFRAWNITAEAAQVRVPVMVVQGLADPYGTVAQVAAAGPRAEAVLLDCVGHAPHLEAPVATMDAVRGFCARVLGEGRR